MDRLRRVLMVMLATVPLACASAPSAADREYSRAVQQIHDRKVEYGEPGELAEATSLCFLTGDEPTRRIFAQAIAANRPSGIAIHHGVVAGDCEADAYVAFDHDQRRGLAFRMNGDRMRIVAEKRGVSAEVFATELLSAFVAGYGRAK